MFFKKLLSKMKGFIVIKYRTEDALNNIKVTFSEDSLKKLDNADAKSESVNWINFEEIYKNRVI